MRFLLINPYVHDFACYDYWMKPLGLLYLSSILKHRGHTVNLVDCMDRNHPLLPADESDIYGKGRFYSRECNKPPVLQKYNRKYRIFGIFGEKLNNILKEISRPDVIILTSGMTYWYPGIKEVASTVKNMYPGVPVILGGIYATLCHEHAEQNISADHIIPGNSFDGLFEFLNEKRAKFEEWPAPDYSDYSKVEYIAIRSSVGCMKECSFCGIKFLSNGLFYKTPEAVKDEIEYLYGRYRVRDFVFYDDSLMENQGILEYLPKIEKEIRFHTPNGIEVAKIDKESARQIKQANFIDPCLAADIIGDKVDRESLRRAVAALFEAGYAKGEVSAYLILGIPGHNLSRIIEDINYMHGLGLKVRLSEYAVVPGTRASQGIERDIIAEPLLHNNSIFPAFDRESWGEIFKVKNYAKRLNHEF